MLPGGAARLAQLEGATQKHAHVLNELQTSLHTERPPPQQQHVHQLAGKVERLDMQLAELCTQVQADDQAKELLSRLSGALKPARPPPSPSLQTMLFAGAAIVRSPSCICIQTCRQADMLVTWRRRSVWKDARIKGALWSA